MTDFICPNCDEEELGTIQDQKTRICLDCGQCDGNRAGRKIKDHEDRVRRMQLLTNELTKLNKNINTDEERDRRERLLLLIGRELQYYHRWVGEEADMKYARENRDYRRRGLSNLHD